VQRIPGEAWSSTTAEISTAQRIMGALTGAVLSSVCGGVGCGVVFKLTPNSKGGWKLTVQHRFADKPGASPLVNVILDSAGNLYETTFGHTSFGTVFEITPWRGAFAVRKRSRKCASVRTCQEKLWLELFLMTEMREQEVMHSSLHDINDNVMVALGARWMKTYVAPLPVPTITTFRW